MTLQRRHFLSLTAALAAMPAAARASTATDYPTRPVRLIVGSPPGSSPDVVARLIGQQLTQRLGQTFVIEDRDGAAGAVAAQTVARSPADGYTLLLVTASDVINPAVYQKLNLDFARDIAPVGSILSLPNLIAVQSSFPVRTLPEFIAAAKETPGKINIGTPGAGSPQFVSGQLFKIMADIDIVLVPYRGGPAAVTDALSGQVQGVIGTVLLLIDHVRSGALRALAVTGATRSKLLPDVPAAAEFVPGFVATQWIGVGAPKETSTPIVDTLNRQINAALGDARMQERLAGLGGTIVASSPAEFTKFISAETDKWARVVNFANGKSE